MSTGDVEQENLDRRQQCHHGQGFEEGILIHEEGAQGSDWRTVQICSPFGSQPWRRRGFRALKDTNLYFAVDFQSIDTAEPVTDP
jgi:hypothetical protein